jgi:hypothetical protein
MIVFRKIPLELFLEIKLYLSELEHWKWLRASKNVFNEIYFDTRRIFLTGKKFHHYIYGKVFQNLILSKIRTPQRQLTFRVISTVYPEGTVKLEDAAVSLALLSMKPCSEEKYILPTIVVSDTSIKIYIFDGLQEIHPDFSGMTKLSLSNCHQRMDVSCLQGIQEVSFYNCSNISNIHVLGKVHTLKMAHCPDVTDISGLNNNSLLTVLNCPNVKPLFNRLNTVQLTCDSALYQQSGWVAISGLRTCRLTSRPYCSELESRFDGLFCLELHRIPSIRTLNNSVQRIPIVVIFRCNDLTNISDLGLNRSVTISCCPQIKYFSSLRNVVKVVIECCVGFTNGHDVENVQDLTIDSCPSFYDASMLGKVQHLKLWTWVESFEGLSNVAILECLFQIEPSDGSYYFPYLGGQHNKKMVFPVEIYHLYEEQFPSILEDYNCFYDCYDDNDDATVAVGINDDLVRQKNENPVINRNKRKYQIFQFGCAEEPSKTIKEKQKVTLSRKEHGV